MEPRPKITLVLAPLDRFLEIIGWVALISLWAFIIWNYSNLPETIATHFSASGEIDRYGSKGSIFILPILASVIFIGLTVLNLFPHFFNYPVTVSAENAQRLYIKATRLIRFLKCGIVLIFSFIVYLTLKVADGRSEGIGIWAFPILLGVIFILLIVFVIKAVRLK